MFLACFLACFQHFAAFLHHSPVETVEKDLPCPLNHIKFIYVPRTWCATHQVRNPPKLVFLHHVLNLEEDDPVKCLYEQMKRLPSESNWLSDVSKSAAKYGINTDEEFLCSCSKDSYKATVRKAIESFAEERLKEECSGLSKTKDLRYQGFKTQPYLLHLYPHHANVIMKCRAKCLDIKSHRPFKYTNKICRSSYEEEETLSHISNW